MRKLVLLVMVVSLACKGSDKRVAELEETLRQKDAQIRQERKAREQSIATDEARYRELLAQKTQADDLLVRLRNVMGASMMARALAMPVSYTSTPTQQQVQPVVPSAPPSPQPQAASVSGLPPTSRRPTDDRGIIDQCTAKWGTNYEMVEYCEKEQQQAKDALAQRESAHPINDAVMAGITRDCDQKWRGNFEMIDYCQKEAISAYQRLNTH